MKTLHISVVNKMATYTKRDGVIICGNSDYQIEFVFDSEWSVYEEKTARFIWNGTHKDVKFTGTICPVPIVTKTSEILVGVYAGELETTTAADIPCLWSILCRETIEGAPPSVPCYDIVQTPGNSPHLIMSQKATTEELAKNQQYVDDLIAPLVEKIAALEEKVAALESGSGGGGVGDVTEWKLLEGAGLWEGDVFNSIMNATGGDANEIFCYSGIPAGTKLKLVCNYSDNWNNPGDGYNPWRAYSGVPVAFDFASGEELLFEATGEDIVIYTVYGYYTGETSHELFAEKSADDGDKTIYFSVDSWGSRYDFECPEGTTWRTFIETHGERFYLSGDDMVYFINDDGSAPLYFSASEQYAVGIDDTIVGGNGYWAY